MGHDQRPGFLFEGIETIQDRRRVRGRVGELAESVVELRNHLWNVSRGA